MLTHVFSEHDDERVCCFQAWVRVASGLRERAQITLLSASIKTTLVVDMAVEFEELSHICLQQSQMKLSACNRLLQRLRDTSRNEMMKRLRVDINQSKF